MLQTKVVQKIKTHVLYSITFSQKRAVYEIMWEKNIVEPGRSQMTIWHLRIALWIPVATNTHRRFAIVVAFPLEP